MENIYNFFFRKQAIKRLKKIKHGRILLEDPLGSIAFGNIKDNNFFECYCAYRFYCYIIYVFSLISFCFAVLILLTSENKHPIPINIIFNSFFIIVFILNFLYISEITYCCLIIKENAMPTKNFVLNTLLIKRNNIGAIIILR